MEPVLKTGRYRSGYDSLRPRECVTFKVPACELSAKGMLCHRNRQGTTYESTKALR